MGRVPSIMAVFVARRTSSGLRRGWQLGTRRGRTVFRHCKEEQEARKVGLWSCKANVQLARLEPISNSVDLENTLRKSDSIEIRQEER